MRFVLTDRLEVSALLVVAHYRTAPLPAPISPTMAKPGKSKFVMVLLQSLVSGHKVVAIRPRIKEELQMMRYDPYVEQHVVYKELKKLKGTAH